MRNQLTTMLAQYPPALEDDALIIVVAPEQVDAARWALQEMHREGICLLAAKGLGQRILLTLASDLLEAA